MDDEILPGPYRTNPEDGNSYRVEVDHGDGFMVITDCFGGHSFMCTTEEWEEWEPIDEDNNA